MKKAGLMAALVIALGFSVGCADLESDELDEDVKESRKRRKNPVIFVHGCYPGPPIAPPPYENASNLPGWDPMIGHFLANGYTADDLHVFLYDGPVCDSIWSMADQLADFVREVRWATGARRVDLVGHSMAGLTTRVYNKYFGGRWRVDDTVILAGSNHGAGAAGFGDAWQAQFGAPAYQGARQMFPQYACEDSVDYVQYALNGCLTPEGRSVWADETPGRRIDYLNLYITNDEINVPQHVACLNQDFIGDCSDSVNVEITGVLPDPGGFPAHVTMLFHPSTIQQTFDFVSARR